MDEELDLHLKNLSDEVADLPVSVDPRTCSDRRTRHVSQFPLKLDSGEIISQDRRKYQNRRSRVCDVTNVSEAKLQELDLLERQLGIR